MYAETTDRPNSGLAGEIRCYSKLDIDGLVQERRNSIANALELRLSCNNPSIWCHRNGKHPLSTMPSKGTDETWKETRSPV